MVYLTRYTTWNTNIGTLTLENEFQDLIVFLGYCVDCLLILFNLVTLFRFLGFHVMESKCHVCENEVGDAHECVSCKRPVHLICGTGIGDEG